MNNSDFGMNVSDTTWEISGIFGHLRDVMEDMKLYNYTQPYTTNNLMCVTFAFNRETLNHGIFECRVSRRSQIRLEWQPVFGFMKIAFLHFCERKKHRNESKISFFSETLFDVH